jgi:hypothetical protein
MVQGKTFHFRIRLVNGSIINTSQWAHDCFQAQALLSRHYPGSILLQVVNEWPSPDCVPALVGD